VVGFFSVYFQIPPDSPPSSWACESLSGTSVAKIFIWWWLRFDSCFLKCVLQQVMDFIQSLLFWYFSGLKCKQKYPRKEAPGKVHKPFILSPGKGIVKLALVINKCPQTYSW